MADIKQAIATQESLTVTGLSTLASATYVTSAEIVHTTTKELDVLVEVTVASTNTVAGNKQLVVFCKGSIDGTNFGSGPESSTTTTDEPDLHFVGVVPMNTSTTTHRKMFSLAGAFGGILPAKTKIVLKNDLGVALTSGTVQFARVYNTVA